MLANYIVVVKDANGDKFRSHAMDKRSADARAIRFNKSNQDKTWNAESAYVTTWKESSHLPFRSF